MSDLGKLVSKLAAVQDSKDSQDITRESKELNHDLLLLIEIARQTPQLHSLTSLKPALAA